MTDLTQILADEPSALAKLRAAGVLPAVDPMEELAREVLARMYEAHESHQQAEQVRNGNLVEAEQKEVAVIATALRSVARPTYSDEDLMGWVDKVNSAYQRPGYAPTIAVLRELVEGKG